MSEYQNPPEIDFDQTERITTRLRDLVHSYPKGLALIKEFLQNADDAGAEDLRVIYDRRHHSGELPNPGMTVALGPALLFFNDQYFTESDFNGIQQIGEGSKGFDAARTGRFGQGFNTCYSVTDHPSLLTGDRIAWFDPHHYALGPGKNARAWKLADVVDAWPAWIQTFAPAAPAYRYARSYSDETLHIPEDTIAPVYYWRPEQGAFPGTVFRLPVRSTELAPRSEILPEAFTDDDFDAILDEIRRIGPALLIFLRSVTSLEIREIDAAGKDTLRYWIHTNNAQQVNEERRKLRDAVHGKPQELLEDWLASDDPLPVIQFDHTFVVSDGEEIKREETWAVTTGLFRGPANVLLKAALEVCRRGDKAIPWAGAAVQRNPIDVAVGRIDRKFACFLPLPLAEETLSTTKSLTIWLHGWFDLNSSRREITSEAGGADGTATHARYEWNRALMEYAVGPAWTLLVQRTLGAASDNPQPYALWPPSLGNHGALGQVLHKGFYRAATALPMIRGQNAQGHHWCTLQNGVRDLFNQRLWAPLLAEGWTLCNPSLPKSVRDGFNSVGHAVSTVTPATLREDLQGDLSDGDIACPVAEATRSMLRQRAWIDALTEFCAEGNWKNLWYLPLALLADDRLHTFTVCGTVYWVEEEERILLAPLPARMLDREFQKKLTLKKPESHGHEVIRLNLSGLIKCIAEILAHKLPIDQKQWLSAVFKYFKNCPTAEITLNEDELKELKLVPDQSGGWHPMGVINTPLIPVPGQTKDLHQALSHLNIAMLHGPRELIEAIREFREAHPGFIKNLHPTNVADYLQAHVEDPTTLNETALDDHEKVLYPLLDFLASTDWLKKDDKRLPQLRKVRILVTVRGERVSADTKNLYLLGGFDPPAGVGAELRILYTKSNDANWKRLFEALGVKTLSTDRFIEEVLLPSFTGATPAQWLVYLTWLRDQYQEIFRELPADKRSLLKQRIIDTAIIPIKGGKLATPKTVYHPQAQEPVELLGDLARFPDIEFKKVRGSIEGAWLDFFDNFELPERPLADDLIAAIRALVEKAKTKDVAAVRKPLRQLIVHINLRWNNDLKKDNYRLTNHLSNLAWIPALSKKDRTKYAEYRDWPDRLYKPSELIISRLGHLAASVYPILDELEFSYLSDLGLRTKVSLKEVLDHFNTIRESTTASNQALSQAAIAVYRFFGDVQPSDSWKIKAFSDKPSVYLNGVWHRPDRCFFNVPVKTRWTIPLQSVGLGTEKIAEKKKVWKKWASSPALTGNIG
jgi:sacsin